MKRHSILLFCLLFLVLGCGDIAPVDSGEVGSESTGAIEEGGEAAEDGDESATDLCIDKDCDDGNPCTDDNCDEVTGDCLNESLPDKACDDGNACSTDDVCGDTGVCAGVGTLLCDDGEACTNDLCDETSGCVFEAVADGETCDDGDSCTMVDACKDGVCAGTAKSCPDDGNPCTVASGCDEKTGECLFLNVPDETLCDDGNDCTAEDTCVEGECLSEKDTLCDDGNECTDDSCDVESGCVSVNNAVACDDGNACTTNDVCGAGACAGTDTSAEDCDDDNVCTTDSCVPATGCVNPANLLTCDDENACTTNDTCAQTLCIGGAALNCDDGNVCTDDFCSIEEGCVHTANGVSCDDGNACTTADTCADSVCVGGAAPECDDGNVCTDDTCTAEEGCVFTPNQADCSDGNECTTGDVCAGANCIPGAIPLDCNDDELCTSDSCHPVDGCVNTANDLPCDDGSVCTLGDTCGGGSCQPGLGSLACDDGNVCTADSCDGVNGCTYLNQAVSCDDGNTCTENDYCQAGECTSGNNVCGCEIDTDCAGEEDGNLCNGTLFCDQSSFPYSCQVAVETIVTCDDSVNTSCIENLCDPATGGCAMGNVNEAGACEDGDLCSLNDICAGGACVSGAPKICDDGNVCTDDACLDGVCTFTANDVVCDDGNACTEGDACLEELCLGAPVACEDGDPCTSTNCNVATGCTYGGLTGPACDDENACTADDTCVSGACGGTSVSCDDDNPCTDDSCDTQNGCLNAPNAVACDDGDACTTGDTCAAKVCVGGVAPDCDDGNVCTDDSCDSNSGCLNAANTEFCDDNNACTVGDVCQATACQPGSNANCDDNDACTSDSCDAGSGCVNTDISADCDDGIACTVDSCDAAMGCVITADDSACASGELCVTDTCDLNAGCVSENTPDCCGNGLVENVEPFEITCDDGYSVTENGTAYLFCPVSNLNWEERRTACLAQGGDDLVSFDAPGKEAFVDSILLSQYKDKFRYWAVGATDSNTEGVWKWVSGALLATPITDCGYPFPSPSGDEDCAFLIVSPSSSCVEWNDGGCLSSGSESAYICEKSNPSSDVNEECDDGNDVDGDGCSSTCMEEFLCPEDCVTSNTVFGTFLSDSQVQKLTAPDTGVQDFYGHVEISGDTLAIAAPFDDDNGNASGSVYIYVKAVGGWVLEQKITAFDGQPAWNFGAAHSLDGDTLAVGSRYNSAEGFNYGAVYVYTRSGTTWSLQQKIVPADAEGNDTFGGSGIVVVGDVLVADSIQDDDQGGDSGSVYVYSRVNSTWIFQQKLTAFDGNFNDKFGFRIGFDGNIIAVAARWDDDKGADSGSVYLYESLGANWTFLQKLTADDGVAGDYFGQAVSVSGDIVVVGASEDDDKGSDSGSVYIYANEQGSYVLQQKLSASDGKAGDRFGASLAVLPHQIVVGAPGVDDVGKGAAYLLSKNGENWIEQEKLTAFDAADGDSFGFTVAIAPGTIIVGAHLDDDQGDKTGSAYVYAGTTSCNPDNTCNCIDGFQGIDCGTPACTVDGVSICNDNNPCTTDTCDATLGCINTNNTDACDDGDACTTSDTCSAGTCVGGAAPDCDDGNVCTDDFCESATGCSYAANSIACEDGNACTTNDTCIAASCAGGAAPNCDDGNVCTTDSCDAALGCLNAANTESCDDGNACTVGDTCLQTGCQSGATANCNDNDACTADSCDVATGCVNTDISADCDDGVACTVDSCDAATGCVNTADDATCASGELCVTDTCDVTAGCVSDLTPDCCGNGLVEGSEPFEVTCTDGYTVTNNGTAYLFCPTSTLTWEQKRTACQAQGGDDLVSLETPEKETLVSDILVSQFTDKFRYWAIGATDLENEGSWKWVSGTSFPTPFTFCTGGVFPSQTTQSYEEDCGYLVVNSPPTQTVDGPCIDWNDAKCSETGSESAYICEKSNVIANPNEECDDGNLVDGDGCSSTCTQESEGIDCAEIHANDPGLPDGTYMIDPDGAGGNDPFEVYCDMTTDGGGWTLILADTDTQRWRGQSQEWFTADDDGQVITPTSYGKSAAFAGVDGSELLLKTHQEQAGYWATFSFDGFLGSFHELLGTSSLQDVGPGYKVMLTNKATGENAHSCWDMPWILLARDYSSSEGIEDSSVFAPSTVVTGARPCGGSGAYSSGIGVVTDTGNSFAQSGNQGVYGASAEGFDGEYQGNPNLTNGYLGIYVRRAICGNGQQEGDEPCDDGNLVDGDGCSSTCVCDGDEDILPWSSINITGGASCTGYLCQLTSMEDIQTNLTDGEVGWASGQSTGPFDSNVCFYADWFGSRTIEISLLAASTLNEVRYFSSYNGGGGVSPPVDFSITLQPSGQVITTGQSLNVGWNSFGFSSVSGVTSVVIELTKPSEHTCVSQIEILGPSCEVCASNWSGSSCDIPPITASGDHTCGLKENGSVLCWGRNNLGQTNVPSQSFASVAAGWDNTCALKSDGSAVCWGGNQWGQSTPPGGSFEAITVGWKHTCGLRSDGSVECWGDNGWGQINPPSDLFESIVAGDTHNCGLKSDGSIVCWGKNIHGQCNAPAGVFKEITAGDYHSCGLRMDGSVSCWGDNGYDGQSTPPSGTFEMITTGWNHNCGIREDGTVDCWGWDNYGQSTPPSAVFETLTAGWEHSCGVKSDGSVVCWGSSDDGQMNIPSGLQL